MSESSCSIAPSHYIKVKAKIWCTCRCGAAQWAGEGRKQGYKQEYLLELL